MTAVGAQNSDQEDTAGGPPARWRGSWWIRNEKSTVALCSVAAAVLSCTATVLSLPLWSGSDSSGAPPEPSATVFVPQNNAVGLNTKFAGSAKGIPDGALLWAFTQHTRSGRYFPGYTPCTYGKGQWECTVRVGGEPGSDSRLILTLVDAKGALRIMTYVRDVESGDRNAGMDALPEHVEQLAVRRVTYTP